MVGCVDTTISTDTAGTNFDCSATNAGGTVVSDSVTIKLDKTKPVISLNDPSNNPVRLEKGDPAYSDAGAQSNDNFDSPEAVVGIHSVNTSTTGIYNVTYNDNDQAGNPADEVIRDVYVSEVNLDTVLVNGSPETEALWGVDDVTVSGTVEGASETDSITVYWGDGNTSGNIWKRPYPD